MLENTPDINTYQSLLTLMESLFQVSSKYRSSLILSETVLLSVSAKRKLHNLNYSQTQCQCVQHTEEKAAFPFSLARALAHLGVMLSVLEYHSVSGEI